MPRAGKNPMGFLAQKPWHPTNPWNVKKKWLREKAVEDAKKRNELARQEFNRETNRYQSLRIAAARGDKEAIKDARAAEMDFMYALPPGLKDAQEKIDSQGDDPAVAAFKKALKARSKREAEGYSMHTVSNLERQVGRKEKKGLTIEEQVERFPMLKNAPLEGTYAKDVRVTFQPFGVQLKNIKCMRCGEWGHQSGARICPKRDQNPNDVARMVREDPMSIINATTRNKEHGLLGSERERARAVPSAKTWPATADKATFLFPGADGVTTAAELAARGGPPPSMGRSATSSKKRKANGEAESSSVKPDAAEQQFLSQLSNKEKRALLKKLKKKEKSSGKDPSSSDSSDDSSGHHHKPKKAKRHKDAKKQKKSKKKKKKKKHKKSSQ